MADIFEEVDEELRKDDAAVLWKKYGIFVWIACLGLIAAVAYFEWSSYQTAKTIEAQVEQFEEARSSLAAGEYQLAQEAFAEIAQSETSIAPLAAQYLAKAQVEGNGDIDRAVETLQNAPEDIGPLNRLGILKAAYLQSDAMTLAELETHLGDLTSERSAVGALALELVAAKAFKEGDFDRARLEFNSLLLSSEAPEGVKQRANIAVGVLPQSAPEPAPEQAPDTDTDADTAETVDGEPAPEGEENEQ